jgi:hypothetical protein
LIKFSELITWHQAQKNANIQCRTDTLGLNEKLPPLKIKFVLDQVKARQAMKAEPPKSEIGPSGPFLIS